MNKKKISVEMALKTVSDTARKKAFRNDLPVAISENGKVILLYADGHREPATPQSLARLTHGKS